MKTRTVIYVVCAMLISLSAFSQVSTGMPPFGSFSGGPDVTNLGNLNVHYTFPFSPSPAAACRSITPSALTVRCGIPKTPPGRR